MIAGVTGFVGKHLSAWLSDEGYQVDGIIREESNLRLLLHVKNWFTWEQIPAMDDYMAIINLAGKAHDTRNTTDPETYFQANHELNKVLHSHFLESCCNKYIYLSSVKAVADTVEGELTEEEPPKPLTAYGQSKWEAEKYLATHSGGRNQLVLRPSMIYGQGNKGNLNLLYQLASRGIPWPLASFENKRSFLSVHNLCEVITEYLKGGLQGGTYNVADGQTASTNELIIWISDVNNKRPLLWKLPRGFITTIARTGDVLPFPLNSERLKKLTESYVVNTSKLVKALGRPLKFALEKEMKETLRSFSLSNQS